MKYRILRTATADEQLTDIINYIAEDTGVNAALNYLNKIEAAIRTLKDFPDVGALPRYAALRRRGYRVLIVERHLIFYKFDPTTSIVMIYAIVDGRRRYRGLV